MESTQNILLNTDCYKLTHMIKGYLNVLAIDLSENATDYLPGRSAMPNKPLEPQPNEDGKVDFFDVPDVKTVRSWKKKLGEFVVKEVAKPELLRNDGEWPQMHPDYYFLANLPTGYKLYTHKKGGTYDYRQDTYLYGSQHVQHFRSPAEFFLHLQWIMTGSPLNADGEPDCHCAYCDTSVTQAEISQRFAHYHPREHGDQNRAGPKGRSPSPPIPAKDYTKLPPSALA